VTLKVGIVMPMSLVTLPTGTIPEASTSSIRLTMATVTLWVGRFEPSVGPGVVAIIYYIG
jgi:hypothetical protein